MARKLLTLFAVALLLFPMWLELKAGEPFTLVIDAGHGGKDPGAKGKIINEKEINLKIALKLGQLVRSNHPDVKVVYTRSTDKFVELDERAEIANRNKADLFISIIRTQWQKATQSKVRKPIRWVLPALKKT